jgi:hypothetical protein
MIHDKACETQSHILMPAIFIRSQLCPREVREPFPPVNLDLQKNAQSKEPGSRFARLRSLRQTLLRLLDRLLRLALSIRG